MVHHFHWGYMALAAVAAFIFGWLWYGPLFGRRWAEEQGFDMNKKVSMKSMTWPMIGQIIGAFLTAYTLTWVLGSLGGELASGFTGVLMTSLIIWTGFYLPLAFSQLGWEKHTFEFVSINASFHFLNLLLIGSIISFHHF